MKASDNLFPHLKFSEIATPANPAANNHVVYFKTDGLLYALDSSGVEVVIGSGGGTNIYVDTNDPRLSDAREWTAATVDQPEAEAGTATTRRAWTAERVRQAMLGWWGGFAAKTTPVDADSIVIADSAASNAPKRLSWANAVAKLRGTFVEGPASAVDGQVMVFDGTTGKKARASGFPDDYPVLNMLKDHGRFDGGKWSRSQTLNDATFSEGIFNTSYNGEVNSNLGKFISNNSDFGGSGGSMHPSIVDLINTVGRLDTLARYGAEFNVLRTVCGTGVSSPVVVAGTTYYLRLFPGSIGNIVAGNLAGKATIGYWIRAVDKNIALRIYGETYLDSVLQSANFVITPDSGWRHIQIRLDSFGGYLLGSIAVYGLASGEIHLALPYVINGWPSRVIRHKQPIVGLAGAGI